MMTDLTRNAAQFWVGVYDEVVNLESVCLLNGLLQVDSIFLCR